MEAAGAPVVETCAPSRYTLYPVTPTASVDADHARFIWLVDTADALKPVGTEGAAVSDVAVEDAAVAGVAGVAGVAEIAGAAGVAGVAGVAGTVDVLVSALTTTNGIEGEGRTV